MPPPQYVRDVLASLQGVEYVNNNDNLFYYEAVDAETRATLIIYCNDNTVSFQRQSQRWCFYEGFENHILDFVHTFVYRTPGSRFDDLP